MIGRTPVAADTLVSQVWAQVVSAAALSPFETSRSRTGIRSPDAIVAFRRNQLASFAASLVAVSGFAKWYDPTASPAAIAPCRLVAYRVSAVSVPAVARTKANRFPAPATCVQLIIPWW